MTRPNIERNKDLVLKRITDKKKWSYNSLAAYFHIHKTTVQEILERDLDKYKVFAKN